MKIKECKHCKVKPVLERWSSGSITGFTYAVRCDNPDRGDRCDWKFYRSMSNNMEDAIRKWNEDN